MPKKPQLLYVVTRDDYDDAAHPDTVLGVCSTLDIAKAVVSADAKRSLDSKELARCTWEVDAAVLYFMDKNYPEGGGWRITQHRVNSGGVSRQVWSVSAATVVKFGDLLGHNISEAEILNALAPSIVNERLDLVRKLCRDRYLEVQGRGDPANASPEDHRYAELLMLDMFPEVKPC